MQAITTKTMLGLSAVTETHRMLRQFGEVMGEDGEIVEIRATGVWMTTLSDGQRKELTLVGEGLDVSSDMTPHGFQPGASGALMLPTEGSELRVRLGVTGDGAEG